MDEGQRSKVFRAVRFTSEHFAVVSGCVFLAGVATASMFTAGYLSVFNSNLIWLVDYKDLIKVGLTIAIFLMGSVWLFHDYVSGFLIALDEDTPKKVRIFHLLAISLVILTYFGFAFYEDFSGEKPNLGEHISQMTLIALLSLVIIRINRWHKVGYFPSSQNTLGDFAVFLFLLTTCGVVFGYHVKDSSRLKETVFLDDRVLYDTAVVLFTDNYAVFYSDDGAVLVIPASRVHELRGQSRK